MKKRTINIFACKKTGKHQSLETAVGKCSKEIKKGEFLKRTGRKAKKNRTDERGSVIENVDRNGKDITPSGVFLGGLFEGLFASFVFPGIL